MRTLFGWVLMGAVTAAAWLLTHRDPPDPVDELDGIVER